jgi:hypothetical protein
VRGVAEDLRRGKLVGGTSWLTRFAVRGCPADYDGWARLGNPGWGFTVAVSCEVDALTAGWAVARGLGSHDASVEIEPVPERRNS